MKHQRGYAVAVFLVLLIMGFLASLVSQLGTVDSAAVAVRDQKNAAVLQEARSALLAWAANHPRNPGNRNTTPCTPVDAAGPPCPDRPGALPCPDRNNDGWADEPCDAANLQTGRFPWRTLNAPDLRDDAGERLWYALSANFRHQTTHLATFAVNAFTQGTLTLCLNGGGACPGAGQIATNLAAVIIAPRAALPAQNRTGGNINLLAHYLEARNAAPGVLFDTAPSTVNPAFNDTVLPISQTELMDAVIPVVSERLRTTVRLAITTSYDPTTANSPRWQGLPYPVAFSDPRTANFDGTGAALPSPMEGLMPAHANAAQVFWVPGTARFVAGEPPGSSIACSVVGGDYNCSVNLGAGPFPVAVTVGALVRNVGRAFVLPYDTSAASIAPGSNVGSVVSVQHGTFGSLNVDAEVMAQISFLGSPATFVLRRPRLDPALTNAALAFSAPTAWFTRNQWQRNVYYAVAPQNAGQNWATPCAVLGCLQITMQDIASGTTATQNNMNGVMVLMGRSLVALGTPDNNPFNYLELANRPPALPPLPLLGNHLQFVTGPARPPTFNDRAVSAHP